MRCPKCGNEMNVQVVSEVKQRSVFFILLCLCLIAVPIIGWILLVLLLRGRKSATKAYAVCQTCGYRCDPAKHPNAAEYSNGAKSAGKIGAYASQGEPVEMSFEEFIAATTVGIVFVIVGLIVLWKTSWAGLWIAIFGIGVLVIAEKRV